ncbi:MAG: hypothetical protein COA50_10190 [Flavobacteriaceae bacterium]|nr:MAG: hypothetical protein COA50_10190 [Flavobacteriaceae bacterium]
MPLFMDIHVVNDDNFSVEEVARAHTKDVAIQDKFGVKQLKYWVNVEQKTIFCLMTGPDKASCDAVHKESHGGTACNIIAVADDEFGNYMGKGESINDLAYTTSGIIDTGYRTLLMVNTFDFFDKNSHCLKKVYQLINTANGTISLQPNKNIVASFTIASDAISCVNAIANLLNDLGNAFEYSLSLVTGKPVDVNGKHLFEEAKTRLNVLNYISLGNKICIDLATSLILKKESSLIEVDVAKLNIIQTDDFAFIEHVFSIINTQMHTSDFNLEKLNAAIGLSKSQSHKRIKAITGVAPGRLILKLRLQESLGLIKNSTKTIAEIAYDLGFNSPTYFTRVFKKEYNVLPTSIVK